MSATRRAFVLLGVAAAVALVVALLAGTTWYAPQDVAQVLVAHVRGAAPQDPVADAILVDLRLPRVVGMFVVGALLAGAGALLQLVLATPLADPYVLGASGGAGIGALAALLLGAGALSGAAAFVGALFATLLTLALARSIGGSPVHVLLAGLCISAITGAALSVLLLGSGPRGSASALAWLLGGIVPSAWGPIAAGAAALAVLLAVSLVVGRGIDALTLGDDTAGSLGITAASVRRIVVATCALATGAAVALAGLVGFVGALVPLAARAWLPAGARTSVPACALAGGAALVLVDTVARTVHAPVELPTGVVAACIGAPVVAVLVRGEAVSRARI